MPLGDHIIDNGLSRLDTEMTDIVLNSALPTTYAEANATYALGRKVFGAGGCFGAPSAAAPNGRQVASTAITDGAIATNGTASHWSAIDTVNARLGAAYTLASSQAVVAGNSFSLPSFTVRQPNQ